MTASEWIVLAPLAAATLTAIAVLIADGVWGSAVAARVGGAGLALAAAAASYAAFTPATPRPLLGVILGGGGYAGIQAVIFALGSLALLGGSGTLSVMPHGGQAGALVVFGAVAAAITACTTDLVVLFIVIEASALTAYAVVAVSRNARSDEASLKYFVQGAVAAGLFALALALVFGPSGGRTDLVGGGSALSTGALGASLVASMLLIAVLSFKIGAFPFHAWAPDAYEAAPPVLAAFISTAPKVAAFSAIFMVFKFSGFAASATLAVSWAFAAIAVASIVFGNLGGLRQTSYTRMLAYSGIAQVGYALVGVAVVDMPALPVTILVVTYSVAAAGAFLGAEAVRSALPEWDGTIGGMSGLARVRPWTAAAIATCMFSLTGIPLTGGFWGKFLVFGGAVAAGWTTLAVIGVVGSVVSFGYYGGVLRSVYLESGPDRGVGPARASASAERATVLSAVIVLALGLMPLVAGFDFLARFLGQQ